MSAESLSPWLALREDADVAARSTALTRAVLGRLATITPLRVLDLGAGTGSNLRYLAPSAAAPQHWLLVDHDPTLLAEAKARATGNPGGRPGGKDVQVETRALDLVTIDRPELFADRHLVTASALLDLVSASWLDRLAAHCRNVGATALFALNYNGQSACTPAEPEDEEVRALMNRHQNTDKGLGGVAAGPAAVDSAERSFTAMGYHVRREKSDWRLVPEQGDLQRQLIEGWAHAAVEIDPGTRSWVDGWLARRLAHVDAERSHVVVGHDDLAAWLP
jgi:SAM-dependent methyltransferase